MLGRFLLFFVCCCLLAACGRGEVLSSGAEAGPETQALASAEPMAVSTPALLASPTGSEPLAPTLRALSAEMARQGRTLVVYVGASWCEPCRHFHDAVQAGALDAVFPTVSFVEFDLDVDKQRLATAGCRSRMIPLFALVDPGTGRCGARIAGSIKGPGAVDNISPRLSALLEGRGEEDR